MYEALIEEQQAKRENRWYAEKAARGEVEVFACRVAVLQLENARLNGSGSALCAQSTKAPFARFRGL